MSTPTVYVICDQNCKFEGMTKEQILTAIAQAVASGEIKDVDTGFVTTIKTITGTPLKFFVGEQATYDALSEEEKRNLFAIITNDTTKEGILTALDNLRTDLDQVVDNFEWYMQAIASGEIAANKANSLVCEKNVIELEENSSVFSFNFELGYHYIIDVKLKNGASCVIVANTYENNSKIFVSSSLAMVSIDLQSILVQLRSFIDPFDGETLIHDLYTLKVGGATYVYEGGATLTIHKLKIG